MERVFPLHKVKGDGTKTESGYRKEWGQTEGLCECGLHAKKKTLGYKGQQNLKQGCNQTTDPEERPLKRGRDP
jgi:hypothetical protein